MAQQSNKEGPFVIGVDAGTESLRAGVFDLQGNPLAFSSTAYQTTFPKPGWAEQNPQDWWEALGKSVKNSISEAGISSSAVAAICLDTTCCSVVALDENGDPLRPCLIWMDLRSAPQTEKVLATGDKALRVNSNGQGPVSAEWMIPKSLWIKENEPDLFEKAATICEFQDYMNLHLTGRKCASINNVSARWHYDRSQGGIPETMLEKLGLGDLSEKWPGDVLDLGETIGGLTPKAAEHLGLPKELPVIQGGADAFIGMVGLGVVKPGSLAFITGSSHLQLGLSDKAFNGTGVWGTYCDALLPGIHAVEGGADFHRVSSQLVEKTIRGRRLSNPQPGGRATAPRLRRFDCAGALPRKPNSPHGPSFPRGISRFDSQTRKSSSLPGGHRRCIIW